MASFGFLIIKTMANAEVYPFRSAVEIEEARIFPPQWGLVKQETCTPLPIVVDINFLRNHCATRV